MYRDPSEPAEWEGHDPLVRFGAYLRGKGLWSDADEARWRTTTEEAFNRTLAEVEHLPPPARATMFEDVYGAPTWNLTEQAAELEAEVARHGSKLGG